MASGAVLVQFDLVAAPYPAHAPFDAQVVGFCTGDANRTGLTIDGKGTTPTFNAGFLAESIRCSNTADPSQGKGFFASVIDGEISIADIGDGLHSPSWMLSHNAAILIGATVHIGYVSALGTVTRLVQLVVADHEIGAGIVTFKLKSPTYSNDSKVFGVRATTALLTSESDPDNPTDPDTLISRDYAQFAGVGFGVNPVVKVNPPVPVSKICWLQKTAFKGGGITGSGEVAAKIVGTTADVVSSPIPTIGALNDLPSLLLVKCRSSTDAISLVARIDAFRSAGYRIVLSDRKWFLDLDSYSAYNGPCSARPNGTDPLVTEHIVYTNGKAYGMDGFLLTPLEPWVWFNWNSTQYDQNTPNDTIDATQVSVYAVPKSISLAAQQCILNGFIDGDKSIPVPGALSFERGVQTFSPLLATSDSIVAADFVRDLKIYYDNIFTTPADAPYKLGAIEDANKWGSPDLVLSGGGSLESVVTDPTVGWNGGSSPAYFQGASSIYTTVDARLRVSARLSSQEAKATFYTVDSSWKSVLTAAGTIGGQFGAVGICDPVTARTHRVDGASSYTLQNKAARQPGYPRWKSSAESLEALRNENLPHPITEFAPDTGLVFQTLRMDLYECFVWGYTNVSFSSIYASISPWWSAGKKSALSTRGSTVICGEGSGVLADGRISWSAWTLPPYGSEVGGSAVSSAMGSAKWVIVGNGDANAPTYWHKTPGAAAWTPGRFSGAGVTRRVRNIPALGMSGVERFVAVFSDGTAKHSTDGATWTDTGLALGIQLTDIAYSIDPDTLGVLYVLVGGSGAVYWSNDLATFNSVGPGSGAGVTFSVEYWGGYFYLGCAAGQVYRATPSQLKAGTWTSVPLGGVSPGDAVAFAGSSTSLVVSAWSGSGTKRLYSTNNGTTWRQVLDTSDLRPSTASSSIWATDLVFMSGGVFVYAEGSQIVTSFDVEQNAAGYSPQWTPEQTDTPGASLARLRGDWLHGMGWNRNPIQWSYGGGAYQTGEAFSLGVNPPETGSKSGGESASDVVTKICRERWIFAGEMPSTSLDGSTDAIQIDFPVVNLGAVQDSGTLISAQFNPVGGSYKGQAYTKNVDKEYIAGNDGFYFGGWGDATKGKAVWDACRAEYLKTGNLRPVSLDFDTVPDATTLGLMLTNSDADLGARISWIVSRPRYVDIVVDGNDSAAAQAFCGCRYKINQTLLVGRGIGISGTGYGIVVNADHDYIAGEHSLTVAFPPG